MLEVCHFCNLGQWFFNFWGHRALWKCNKSLADFPRKVHIAWDFAHQWNSGNFSTYPRLRTPALRLRFSPELQAQWPVAKQRGSSHPGDCKAQIRWGLRRQHLPGNTPGQLGGGERPLKRAGEGLALTERGHSHSSRFNVISFTYSHEWDLSVIWFTSII